MLLGLSARSGTRRARVTMHGTAVPPVTIRNRIARSIHDGARASLRRAAMRATPCCLDRRLLDCVRRSPPAASRRKTITVFAAASLKNALDDINAAFTARRGIKVVASYAASSALMKQIEQGAPADIFISADLDWMDYGSQKKLIKDDTRINLLGNRLVLIAPKDSKIGDVDDRAGLRSRQARRRRPHRHRRRAGRAGRPLRQGGAGKARLWAAVEASWRWPRMCARRWRWSRAARRRSASSTRPTPRSSRR